MSRRGLLIGAIAVVTASVASANYHFVHYASTSAPYTPIFERFQIETMLGGVVPYFIQEPPANLQLSAGDTFPSLVSQIRAAAEVWNSVGTSTFRFTFGGMATPNITMNTPAVLVSFDDDLPPGIEALGGPVTRGDMVTPANGQTFVPIVQSAVVISTDMRSPSESSTGSGPSWSDRLFLTMVHELGHAAGLQHTWTSSVMSTEITRAMTKSHPLGQDDAAGISMLYPTSDWATSYGSITGQVMLGNQGVNLASVVALTTGGEAISTLTNPDGTYVLSGLPAGSYQVYVHPVPPSLPSELLQPVNLVLPVDSQATIALSPAFNTIFQTGTTAPGDPVQVTAGQATAGVNFSVTQRGSVSVYDVQTYSYIWNNAAQAYDTEKPATFLLGDTSGPYAVAAGNGLLATDGIHPAPGLTVSVLGAPGMMGTGAVKAYPYAQGYLEFDLSLAAQSVPGRRHLVFSLNGETEILPSALMLTSEAPPTISSLQSNSDGTVTVSGSGLDVGTRVLFDGVSAAVLQSQGGAVTVVPPPAMPAANAAVIALSPSGLDSSSFAPAAAPPAYSYANNGTPAIQVTPNAVAAGSDAILDLTGTNVNFAVSGLRLGFGTSDITVRHIWLLSAQHAQVAISVSPAAVQGLTTLTLSAGLQLVENSLSFQITGPSQLLWASLASALPGSLTPGLPYPYPLVFRIENVPDGLSAANFSVAVVTASGVEPVSMDAYVGGQILIELPANLAPGPLTLQFTCNGTALPPVVLDVSAANPVILQASNSVTATVYTGSAPAYPGDVITLVVTNLASDIAPVDLNSLSVSVNGVAQTVYSLQLQTYGTSLYTVQFKLDPQTQLQAASGSLPLTIANGARVSASFALPVAAPAASTSN
jgi:hypothetical protein